MFGVVRCTYWSLGESMKPGGVVNNFVMAAFCYHLYSRPGGHPEVSKCHYFFSSIGVSVMLVSFAFIYFVFFCFLIFFIVFRKNF